MHDSLTITRTAFEVDAAGKTEWFDVRTVAIGSLEVASETLGGFTATLELVYGNQGTGKDGTLFSPTKEITAVGTTPTLDVQGLGFGWLGVRVKTAGAGSERARLIFHGRADNGTGRIEERPNSVK